MNKTNLINNGATYNSIALIMSNIRWKVFQTHF